MKERDLDSKIILLKPRENCQEREWRSNKCIGCNSRLGRKKSKEKRKVEKKRKDGERRKKEEKRGRREIRNENECLRLKHHGDRNPPVRDPEKEKKQLERERRIGRKKFIYEAVLQLITTIVFLIFGRNILC